MINTAKAHDGWGWYVCAWVLFARNPGMWIALALIYLLVILVLAMGVPFIGGVVTTLISPALLGGMMFAAREVELGRKLDLAYLFKAFTDDTKTSPMIILGAITLGMWMVISMVMAFFFVGIFIDAFSESGFDLKNIDPESLLQMVNSVPFLIGTFVVLSLWMAGAMATFYSPALVMLRGMDPFAALVTSFKAALRNWLSLLFIFFTISAVFFIVAALPFFLGLVLFFPIYFIATYCSYRTVFQ
ncbi:MAG TPA: hypothetical protein ENI80_02640 [Acidiferrobacteraceae bacterium]|nr:hypothetical protein [Acidiferrobacteraceae bacterium]